MPKPNNKATEKRVERIFYAYCNRVQIPIMRLPKLFKLGVEAADAGKTDAEIGELLLKEALAP
jgi:hypothetical protein